jgi:hypothetical protein
MLLRIACCVLALSRVDVAYAEEDAPGAEPPLDIPSGLTLGFTLGGAMATGGIAGMVASLDAFPEGDREGNDRFILGFGTSLATAVCGVTLTGVTVAIGVHRIESEKAAVAVAIVPVPGGAGLAISGAF